MSFAPCSCPPGICHHPGADICRKHTPTTVGELFRQTELEDILEQPMEDELVKKQKQKPEAKWRKLRCVVEGRVPPTSDRSERDLASEVQYALDQKFNTAEDPFGFRWPSRVVAKSYKATHSRVTPPAIKKIKDKAEKLLNEIREYGRASGTLE